MSKIETITPARAAELVKRGAVLIDVRETHEHAAEHIPGARHHALSQLDAQHPVQAGDNVLIFHCKSGARTNMHARRLAAKAGGCEVYLLGGGIEAWRRAGLPTASARASGGTGAAGGLLTKLSSLFR